MKFKFTPQTELEKFGFTIQNLLVENFSKTFFVGGTVRDMLLKKELCDIDIATSATPEQVSETLKKYFVELNTGFKNMGVILALNGKLSAAIATFRKDLPADSRYPEIKFIRDPKTDSIRRDFTINSLYFQPLEKELLDFHGGVNDLEKHLIRFIGNPEKRIYEDPLRIVRALRFALTLEFKIEKKTFEVIKDNFNLVKEKLTAGRITTEVEKIKLQKNKKIILQVINNEKLLDKYFIRS